MRWIPALTGQSAKDVVVAADEDEIHRVTVSGASGVCSATRQGLDGVAQLLQYERPCGHRTWIDTGLFVVEGAVGELKEEAVTDRTLVVDHFDVDELGALAEVSEKEAAIRLMSRNLQPDSRPLEELVHRFI